MAELAVAYISLVPSLGGAKKQIEKELGGIPTEGAGKKIGGGLASSIGRTLKVGAVAAGAAAGGVLATALAKGFGRLKSIENAQAKMRGLGHDAETVATAMDNSLKAVQGTAFGLGDAATVAAGAMAAQIKPGEKLEKHLTRVSNNAAAAGVSYEEMGSIFNKAATQANGVQNDIIGQLADKGIPIYEELGKVMGVTGGEVFKLASEGKVSFEQFSEAAEKAAGTVAEEMGNTTTGAFDNMLAALGRLGAQILEDIFPLIGPLFKNLTAWIDGATTAVKPLVDGFSGLIGLFKDGKFSASIREAFGWEEDSGIVSFLFRLRETAISVFSEVTGGVKAMIAAFQAGGSDVTSSGFAGVLERVGLAARAAADFVKGSLIPGVIDLGKWMVRNKDWIISLAVGIGSVVLAFKAWQVAVSVWQGITKAATAVQAAFNVVMNANPIMLVVTAVAALVAGLVYFFTQTETGKQIWAGFVTFLQESWANITQFFTEFGENISQVWTLLWLTVSTYLSETWANIKQFFADALQFVVDLFLNWTVYGLIIKNWDAIQTFFVDLWAKIIAGINNFAEGVVTVFTSVTDFIQGIPATVLGFFDGIGTWLLDSGKALIQGFLDGIMSGFEAAKGFVSDGLSAIRNLFPFSPAKEGPFSGRGWVAYSGVSLGETFTQSVANSLHNGRSEISDELGGIQDDFDDFNGAGFSVGSSVPDFAGASAGGGPLVQQTNNFEHLDPEIASQLSMSRITKAFGGV